MRYRTVPLQGLQRGVRGRASKFGQRRRFSTSSLTFAVNLSSRRRLSGREEVYLTSQHRHLRAVVNHDGAAILDLKSGTISTLNSTGAVIWQSLERGEDTETIAQSLVGQTGEDIVAVRKDVADFVEALKKQNLLPC
jgi:hypothetical protein